MADNLYLKSYLIKIKVFDLASKKTYKLMKKISYQTRDIFDLISL